MDKRKQSNGTIRLVTLLAAVMGASCLCNSYSQDWRRNVRCVSRQRTAVPSAPAVSTSWSSTAKSLFQLAMTNCE